MGAPAACGADIHELIPPKKRGAQSSCALQRVCLNLQADFSPRKSRQDCPEIDGNRDTTAEFPTFGLGSGLGSADFTSAAPPRL